MHRVTTCENELYNKWEPMTTSGTTSDKKWQRMTTSDNEWQEVVILTNFSFSWIREEPTTMHLKETL